MSASEPVKRRKRASLVCNRCKRRKIKCDKKKPCSSCKKVDYPCAYDSSWAPGILLKSSPGLQFKTSPHELLDHTEHDSSDMRSTQTDIETKPSSYIMLSELIDSKLPYTHRMEEMILMSRRKFDQLTKTRDSTALIGDFEAVIAPITIGNIGHNAFNANAGIVKSDLHDRKWPGRILFEALGAKQVKFEAHITKLVKNDFVGINPFQSYDERIFFLDPCVLNKSSDSIMWDHTGVFSWRTLQKKDGWLHKLLTYITKRSALDRKDSDEVTKLPLSIKTPQSVHSTFSNDSSREADERIDFLRNQRIDANRSGAIDDIEVKHNVRKLLNQLPTGTLAQSTDANALGLMLYEDDIKFDIKLIRQMQMMLPKKRVVWLLVRRFFRVLYAFAPYLDEYDFRTVISNIIGEENLEDVDVEFHLADKLDVIHISILLVMIRFSYVSLFSNRVSANEVIINSEDPKLEELRYLFKNPVNLNCIELSHRCLHHMLFLKIINVSVLQLTLFLRTYNYLAPEEGDGSNGSSSQIFNSLLVQMAYILGFNRDPSNYPGTISSRQANLIRKIWTHLNVSDVFQGYRFGNPIATNPDFGDTRLPVDEENNENIFDKELDRSVTRVLNFSDVLSGGAMRRLIDLASQPVFLPHFTSLLNLIEVGAFSVFGKLKDYLQPLETINASYSYGKLVKCALLLSLNSFFITCLSHLLAFYKAQNNAALYAFYFKKILFLAISEILPVIPAFVTKLEEIFGDGVAVWMNPLIIDAIFRVNEVIITSIMKSNNYILKEKRSKDHERRLLDPDYFTHFQKLCEVVVLLERFSKICIVAESIMSNRYYFAWRIFKSHQKFLQTLNEPEFYNYVDVDPEATATEGPQNFTSSQLQEIIDLFKSSVHFLEKQMKENLREFCVEELLSKSGKIEVPSILRNGQGGNSVGNGNKTSKETVSELKDSSKMADSLRASPGNISSEISNMLELDLFMLDDFDAFNNNEVDLLWLQMSNQKLQKHKDMDEFVWQSIGDGSY